MEFIEYCTEREKQNVYLGTHGCMCIGCLPPDRMADWELCLLPCPTSGESISLVWEKIKIQNLKYGFY